MVFHMTCIALMGTIIPFGGKFSENCYWACPAGKKPTYKNLIEFNGDAPTWGIVFDRSNYTKQSGMKRQSNVTVSAG